MLTKPQLIAAMAHECDVCKHLFTKLTPAAYDYRPSPGQRSTLELLRYLTYCGSKGIGVLAQGSFASWKERDAEASTMPAEDFPAAMDRQKAEIAEAINAISDDDLRNRDAKLPDQREAKLGAALVQGPLLWLTAYKMQLFLYAKAAGASDINTANAWAGMEMAEVMERVKQARAS